MKRISVDFDQARVTVEDDTGTTDTHPLGSAEGFAAVSRAWLRAGWDVKYVYTFSWMGRPVIQLPEDLLRAQEVIYSTRPTVVVETGVAHGGSLVFYACVFEGMGEGRVIGVDIDIRAHNRAAIERHELYRRITLIEGSSTDAAVTDAVQALLAPSDRVMVILDSNHTKEHVLAELEAYAPLVTRGCFLIAADGIMEDLVGAPRTSPEWRTSNPRAAVREFLARHEEFEPVSPPRAFDESTGISEAVSYWGGGWLRRR